MKYWITTDTHFNHRRLEQWGRPESFEEKILDGFKGKISIDDILIHLGDFAMGQDTFWAKRFLQAVPNPNMQKILVRGNHDGKSYSWYLDNVFEFVCEEFVMKFKGKKILFSHRPMPRREGIDYNIHGHTHGKSHREEESSSFYDPTYHIEIALENTNYQPVNLDSIIK